AAAPAVGRRDARRPLHPGRRLPAFPLGRAAVRAPRRGAERSRRSHRAPEARGGELLARALRARAAAHSADRAGLTGVRLAPTERRGPRGGRLSAASRASAPAPFAY